MSIHVSKTSETNPPKKHIHHKISKTKIFYLNFEFKKKSLLQKSLLLYGKARVVELGAVCKFHAICHWPAHAAVPARHFCMAS